MRGESLWADRKRRIFLVPYADGNEDTAACFEFDKGRRIPERMRTSGWGPRHVRPRRRRILCRPGRKRGGHRHSLRPAAFLPGMRSAGPVLLQMDLVLMRFAPLLGASFDVLMADSQSWLCDFFA